MLSAANGGLLEAIFPKPPLKVLFAALSTRENIRGRIFRGGYVFASKIINSCSDDSHRYA